MAFDTQLRWLVAVMLCVAGCRESKKAPPPSVGVVVVSCDTAGWIVPCGCTANQSGGLNRRGGLIDQYRRQGPVLYVDVGGAAAGNSPYQQLKFESILAGEIQLGVAAHNLGQSELSFGPDKLRDIAGRTRVPFLSANAHDRVGKLLADTMKIVPLAGKRLGIVGLVSPAFATDSIAVDDPRAALSAVESAHAGQYDSLLVLAYLPEAELAKLAAESPEADAVVGGPTGQSIVPRAVGPTLLAAATNKGKFVAVLTPPASSATGGWSGQIEEVGPTLPEAAEQAANLDHYLAALHGANFSADQSGLVAATDAPADYRFAGSAACVSCHAAIAKSFDATHHASAWSSLVKKRFGADPYCQQCHTTGYGQAGGFVSMTASVDRLGVGCESCHGPSQRHVVDPHVRTPFAAFDQCVRCHDHENSPAFDRPVYWARIAHGHTATDSTGQR